LAAHLLNRATFAPLPAEIDRVVADGLEKSVDRLLSVDSNPDNDAPPATPDPAEHSHQESTAGLTPAQRKQKEQDLNKANHDSMEQFRGWWIGRMATSQMPLREKLTLFWHGHFTSSAEDVKSARLMFNQNEFFRKHCLADFRTLLLGISRDPAMLRYLDNNTNRRQHPNENYARELMELFTLGIGNYTEDDVKAAARAFTGWSFEGEEFVFHRREHDDGEKTYLGETGNWDGTDAIDIILKQPATGRFMATKFLKYFVADNPEPAVVEAVAESLRTNKYEFKPVLREIFTSAYFYSPHVYRLQIKSPAQLVVGSVRLVNAPVNGKAMAVTMRELGQDLLYPPTVKGWDGGETWINTTTLLLRYNYAGYLLGGETPPGGWVAQEKQHARPEHFDKKNELSTIVGPDLPGDPAKLVDLLGARLLQTKLDPKDRQWLLGEAETTRLSERTTRVAHLIMSMPAYQLC
jgi:uncharacterized protein (DUF1800 family)